MAAGRPQSERSADLRRRVMDAAVGCFLNEGYDATTMEDLRAASGVSIGTIYHHFGGKDGVASAIYVSAYRHYADVVLDMLANARTPRAAITQVAVRPLQWVRELPDVAPFVLNRSPGRFVRGARHDFEQTSADLLAGIRAWTAPHVAKGTIRDLHPATYLALWCGPSWDLARRWLFDGPLWEEALDEAEATFGEVAWLGSAVPKRR